MQSNLRSQYRGQALKIVKNPQHSKYFFVCLFVFHHFQWNWSHNLQWHLQKLHFHMHATRVGGCSQPYLHSKSAATKWRPHFFFFFLATQNNSIKLDRVTQRTSVHSCYWTMPVLFCIDCWAISWLDEIMNFRLCCAGLICLIALEVKPCLTLALLWQRLC